MNDVTIHVIGWVLAGLGACLSLAVGVWWRVESRQDRKIDGLSQINGKEHRDLHDKIDANHHSIRDKLDNIWKHISKGD